MEARVSTFQLRTEHYGIGEKARIKVGPFQGTFVYLKLILPWLVNGESFFDTKTSIKRLGSN